MKIVGMLAVFFLSNTLQAVHNSSPTDIKKFHRQKLLTTKFDEFDVDFSVSTINIHGDSVIRSILVVDGIPVEGADAVFKNDLLRNFTYLNNSALLNATKFNLSVADALQIVLQKFSEFPPFNPYVEKLDGMFSNVLLYHFGKLRPTYKLRPRTFSIFQLKDFYVAADNGEILKIEPAAQFISAPAKAFLYSPSAHPIEARELKNVELKNLLSLEENEHLNGEFLDVRTCCRYFTCPGESSCDDDKKRCALKSHKNAQQRREMLEISSDSLGLNTALEKIYFDVPRCTFLPFAKANRNENSTLGFFYKPTEDADIYSEMDAFSEIQVYFSMMSFFNHIRSLLGDPTWCLREAAMSCDENGNILLNENGTPKNRYRVFVNQLIPNVRGHAFQSDKDAFLAQISTGKGSKQYPIVIEGMVRIGNAAFIPALSTLKKNTPRVDEIFSDLIKPYDHNVFFQGERDFAYDGDVVFHEFMHAIIATMMQNGKLNTLGLDKFGINSESGALNEGWADYFTAAFTKKPLIGKYASTDEINKETGLRNIDNDLSCPANIIGEIHNDSLIWSGALWEIRQKIAADLSKDAALDFDRVVLTSLAMAQSDENFKNASKQLIKNIEEKPTLGLGIAEKALAILKKRGAIDCFKVFPLSEVNSKNKVTYKEKNLIFVPSKINIGLKNYAPSGMQAEIAIPAGAKKILISWHQYFGDTTAINDSEEATPTKNVEPLGVIMSLDKPINWRFLDASSLADVAEEEHRAFYGDGAWHIEKEIQLNDCEQAQLYISFLSHDFQYILSNIKVGFGMDFEKDQQNCDYRMRNHNNISFEKEAEQAGCSNKQNADFFFLSLVFAILTQRNKYKK